MFVMPVIFMVVLLGRTSDCKETLRLPVGDNIADAKLGKTIDLFNLYYKIPIAKNAKEGKIETPLNTYRESIRVVNGPVDIAEMTGYTQPTVMLLSTGAISPGGVIQDLMKEKANSESIKVVFYAEKLEKKEEMSDNIIPSTGWQTNFRLKDTTHYVKELIHGSILFYWFKCLPQGDYKLDDIKPVITKILKEHSSESNAIDAMKKLFQSSRFKCGPRINQAVEGAPSSGASYDGYLDRALAYRDLFQASAAPEVLAVGLRPLMDFNPTNEAFILNYSTEQLAPFMEMTQTMFLDAKNTKDSLEEYFKTKYYEESAEEFYSTVSSVLFSFYKVFGKLNFKEGSAQFLPAFKAYKYRVGHYQDTWNEFLNQPKGNKEKESEKQKGEENDLSNKQVLEKVNQLTEQVNHLLPGEYFTAKLDAVVSGKGTVIFTNILSGGSQLYDVTNGLMTAPDKGLYHVTYSLQTDSTKKTVVKIMRGEETMAEGISDVISCETSDCSHVISGSFTIVLQKDDKLKVEMEEGGLKLNSFFSVTCLRRD